MKNTKKLWLFAIALTVLTLLLTLCASAETVSGNCGASGEEASVTWSFDTETGNLTISGKGAMKEFSSVSEAPWYTNRSKITSLTIEEGITIVGARAFNGLKITTLTLPSTTTKIGNYAFQHCKSLAEVTISGNISSINDRAFNGCVALTKVTINEGTKALANRAFMGCTALESIIIPASVTTMGTGDSTKTVFVGCTNLKSVTFLCVDVPIDGALPEQDIKLYGLKDSAAKAFADKDENDNITFEYISLEGTCGTNATWSYSGETGQLTISGSGKMDKYTNTTMPWYAYRKVIDKIVIEEGVTSIGERAFSESSVKSVVIADSVTSIDDYSFRVCENLADIHIGSGVTYIGEYAINGCKALKSLVIPGNVKTLEHHAINNCTALTDLTLGEGIETLKNQAINGCKALAELVIPSTVKTVGTNGQSLSAFNACSQLAKITFLTKDAVIYPDSDAAIPASATIYGYEGSTVQSYAAKYNKSFEVMPSPFAYNCITGFDITVDAVKAAAGEYLTVASLERLALDGEFTLKFLAVDENGALYAYNADGGLDALFNTAGKAIVLADNTAISIVYNDENGTARFYVNKLTPKYGSDLESVTGYPVASEEFLAETAVSEKFILADGVTQNNVTAITEAPALFAGFQTDDTHRSIRFLAGIDNLYYDSIGYEISLYCDGVLQGSKTETISTVYSSVLDEKQPVTAEELGFNYLALATVTNIDRTNFPKDSIVYFRIKPFSTIGDEKLYGREKSITITYDYTRQENNFIYGIDAPFVPVLRFIATSDIHFKGAAEGDYIGGGAPNLKAMMSQLSEFVLDELKNDGYTGLDAVILAGDIANDGTEYQLNLAKNYLDEIIPEDTELVITTGNHDFLEWETIGADGSLKLFEDAFGPATKDTVINGYHFITLACDGIPTGSAAWRGYGSDYSAETLAKAEEMIQAALEDTGPDNPIFIIQHIPNADTVAGSNKMAPCSTLKEMQDKYPNLVIFAGHSHHPLNDECSIYQDKNTAIGTGTIQVSQVHLVEVDEYGRVRLRKYSGTKRDFVGETWFVDSYDPRDFVYTSDRFTEDDLFFAEDAEINLEYIGANTVSFNFLPVPDESLTARGYKIVLKDSTGAVIKTEFVEHDYKIEDFTTPITHSFSEFTADTEYSISVCAVNPMFETDLELESAFASEPITLDFKTSK